MGFSLWPDRLSEPAEVTIKRSVVKYDRETHTMETGQGTESGETDNGKSWLPLLIVLVHFLNALSLTFECSESQRL